MLNLDLPHTIVDQLEDLALVELPEEQQFATYRFDEYGVYGGLRCDNLTEAEDDFNHRLHEGS